MRYWLMKSEPDAYIADSFVGVGHFGYPRFGSGRSGWDIGWITHRSARQSAFGKSGRQAYGEAGLIGVTRNNDPDAISGSRNVTRTAWTFIWSPLANPLDCKKERHKPSMKT